MSTSTTGAWSTDEEAVRKAIQLASQQRCGEAAAELKEVIEGSPTATPAWYQIAECYMKQNDWKKAATPLDSFLRNSPQSPAGLFLKSYLLFRTGQYQESLKLISDFLNRQPDHADARKILGLNYFMLGKQDEAKAELKRATELNASDPEAAYYLGRICFTRNEMPEALMAFQKSIQLDPGSAKAHNHLGQTHESLVQYDEAQRAYLKAIELERQPSRLQWPCFNLGSLYLKQGRFTEAIDYLRRSVLHNPDWTEGKLKLAIALLSSGDLSAARRELQQVLTLEPHNADAHYQLARLLGKLGEREKALQHYEQFERLKTP